VIDKIQKNNINWTPIFQEINISIPEGIIVKSISNEEYGISMAGVAENRDKLIDMKSKIEKNNCFEEISIPINNIVLKNNIDFKVDFNVSKNCLIKYEE
jgi:Tfp pilus assembly protein PilN